MAEQMYFTRRLLEDIGLPYAVYLLCRYLMGPAAKPLVEGKS